MREAAEAAREALRVSGAVRMRSGIKMSGFAVKWPSGHLELATPRHLGDPVVARIPPIEFRPAGNRARTDLAPRDVVLDTALNALAALPLDAVETLEKVTGALPRAKKALTTFGAALPVEFETIQAALRVGSCEARGEIIVLPFRIPGVMILGADFLVRAGAKIDLAKMELRCGKNTFPVRHGF